MSGADLVSMVKTYGKMTSDMESLKRELDKAKRLAGITEMNKSVAALRTAQGRLLEDIRGMYGRSEADMVEYPVAVVDEPARPSSTRKRRKTRIHDSISQ